MTNSLIFEGEAKDSKIRPNREQGVCCWGEREKCERIAKKFRGENYLSRNGYGNDKCDLAWCRAVRDLFSGLASAP